MTQKTSKTISTPSAKATKAARATKAKLTLNEFRAWLSGVEEMQSDDWTPDHTQWRRIRSKIDEIVETVPRFNTGGAGPSRETQQPAHREYRAAGPSFAQATPAVAAAPPPTFVNTSGTDGARLKTPNIDTSAGGYSSSLE